MLFAVKNILKYSIVLINQFVVQLWATDRY